ESELVLWNLPERHVRLVLPRAGSAWAWAPDGQSIAMADTNGPEAASWSVRLVNAKHGDVTRVLVLPKGPASSLQFTPDGRHLIAECLEGRWGRGPYNPTAVRVWSVSTGEEVAYWSSSGCPTLCDHGQTLTLRCYSPIQSTYHVEMATVKGV